MVAQTLRLIGKPELAPLFAQGSRAEVPIAGTLERTDGEPLTFSGRIDRLAVAADAVFLADFKSGRAPKTFSLVHVTQLALYWLALKGIHSDRPVRAFLVWTEDGRFLELDEPQLNEALRELADKG